MTRGRKIRCRKFQFQLYSVGETWVREGNRTSWTYYFFLTIGKRGGRVHSIWKLEARSTSDSFEPARMAPAFRMPVSGMVKAFEETKGVVVKDAVVVATIGREKNERVLQVQYTCSRFCSDYRRRAPRNVGR